MSNTLESHPQASQSAPSENADRTAAIVRAAIAEGIWTSLFALLPFAGEKLAQIYMDRGVDLSPVTLGVLRFARAMHPTPNLIPYIALLCGVGMVCGWLILASAAGSAPVRRAAKFAATVMLGVGIIAWIGVAGALLLPYITTARSIGGG